jgi:NADH-quinone oxidoreductase subunit N
MNLVNTILAATLIPNPFSWEDVSSILPTLILFVTASLVLVLDLLGRDEAGKKPPFYFYFISLLGTLLAGACLCARLGPGTGGPQSCFLGAVLVDNFSSAMSLLIVLGTAFSLLGAIDALGRRGIEHGEFHSLMLIAAGSMMLFTQSASLIMIFLSLETLSMAVYVLTAYTRDEKRSVEGALKYFVLGGLSTAFLLLGLAFIYGATGKSNLTEIAAVLTGPQARVDAPLLLVGLGLTVVGLGFKIGAFPFHSWVPDAYEGATTVVTGFMAVTVKVASFAVLLRLTLLFADVREPTADTPVVRDALVAVLGTLAALTMIFGNLVALVQSSFKRMLAYSAIAHTGYLLVGVVAAASAPAARGASAAVTFYLFPYALMSLGIFTCLSYLGRGEREQAQDLEDIASYRGLAQRQPLLAFGILILMVSFAGIPPTAGFWGKLYIFRQAIESGHWGLALIGILTSLVSFYYYLGIVVAMYMQPATEGVRHPASDARTSSKLAIAVAVGAVILVGLFPDVFFELSAKCAIK